MTERYLDHVTMSDSASCPTCGEFPCVGLVAAAGGATFPPDPNAPRPWRWLDSTVALQRDYFNFDWDEIGRTPANVAASLKDNTFAILVELAEASVEYSWKHWAKDEPFVERDRVLKECVDVGHFLANMLTSIDVTDEEWEAAYQAKQEINRERMRTGTYSARKGGLGDGSD